MEGDLRTSRNSGQKMQMRLLHARAERHDISHLLGGRLQGWGLGLERFHGRPHPLHQAASVETERERKRGQKALLSFCESFSASALEEAFIGRTE